MANLALANWNWKKDPSMAVGGRLEAAAALFQKVAPVSRKYTEAKCLKLPTE